MARIVHYPVWDGNKHVGATARGICKAVLRSTTMLAVVFADDGCAVIHHLTGSTAVGEPTLPPNGCSRPL